MLCSLVGAMGCTTIRQCMPNNFMCPPDAQCEPNAGMQQLPVGAETVIFDDPAMGGPADVYAAQIAVMGEKLETLERDKSVMREQMSVLDQQAEESRLKAESLTQELQGVTGKISVMETQLSERQAELIQIADHVKSQSSQHERILADVERQLDESLSQYEE